MRPVVSFQARASCARKDRRVQFEESYGERGRSALLSCSRLSDRRVALCPCCWGWCVRTRGQAYRLTLGTRLLASVERRRRLAAQASTGVLRFVPRDWFPRCRMQRWDCLPRWPSHSAARGQVDGAVPRQRHDDRAHSRSAATPVLPLPGAMQMFAAATGRPLPWSAAHAADDRPGDSVAALLLTTRRAIDTDAARCGSPPWRSFAVSGAPPEPSRTDIWRAGRPSYSVTTPRSAGVRQSCTGLPLRVRRPCS
jgi:hypothetical protein